MPREIVNVNEMERRLDESVHDFFEDYKRKASVAPNAYPLDRALGAWLDDLQTFLDVDEFKRLGVIPFLRETISRAKLDEEFRDSPE